MNEPRNKVKPDGPAPHSAQKKTPPQTPPSSSETKAQEKKLTPEEQMAKFEDDLKENDWGHQPC